MTKNSRQKLKYLEKEKSFIIFKGFSIVKNYLRPESVPLKTNSQVCTVLEKSKETVLEFYKGTAKVL